MIILVIWALALVLLLVPLPSASAQWLRRVPLVDGSALMDWLPGERRAFLRFGAHTYEPLRATTRDGHGLEVRRGEPLVIAPFQELFAVPWQIVGTAADTQVRLERPVSRDGFWDQILQVDTDAAGALPHYRVIETGRFGSALPPHVRDIAFTQAEIAEQQSSLTDPIIFPKVAREIPWHELESKALPLDFQKVLLASLNDASPAFAFQNGQWTTTWPSHAAQWAKGRPLAGC
jgi:hypothetical protein